MVEKEVLVKIGFIWDVVTADDVKEFKIIVPEDTEVSFVEHILEETHDMLTTNSFEDHDELYGRCETCEHYGNCNVCSCCDEGSEYKHCDEDVYGKCEREPETLVSYVCNKHGWKYEKVCYDVELSLS